MGTNELTYVGNNKGDIDFQEITPTVKWQYNSNLSLSAFYAMLTTDRDRTVMPHFDGTSATPGTADSEDRNRLQIEVRYTF